MPHKITFTEQNADKIVTLYQDGWSCEQIGKELNCSKQTINKLLKERAIPLRDKSHAHQKYHINENIFEAIDTQEKAYWLGMLTGDGWITDRNDFGLSLEQSDKDIVDKFKNFLSSTHPTRFLNNGMKKDGTPSISYTLTITNQKIVSDLRKYGFTHDKTHFMNFPNLAEEFLANYMLGLVDSDGSFYLKTHYKNKHIKLLNFNFIGPTEFVEKFQKLLIKNCQISKTKLGTQKNTSFVRTVEYAGYKNIFKIVKFLYSNPIVWMNRKKKIAIEYLINKYPNDQWLIDQSQNASLTEMTKT